MNYEVQNGHVINDNFRFEAIVAGYVFPLQASEEFIEDHVRPADPSDFFRNNTKFYNHVCALAHEFGDQQICLDVPYSGFTTPGYKVGVSLRTPL